MAMTFFDSGRAMIRRVGMALSATTVALAAALVPLAGSAQAATNSQLYAATVQLDSDAHVVAQLLPGDVVVGTVNVEMDPIPPGSWFWFTVITAPGFTKSFGVSDGPFQMQFTATAAGPLTVSSIGTGTAYMLFTVTHHTTRISAPISTVGATTW
jgi:hypothetical protein